MHSAIRNQVASPLLRLPAELRTRIYAYAFQDNILNVNPRTGQLDNRDCSRGLMFACRQISSESKQMCMDEISLRLPSPKNIYAFKQTVSPSTLAEIRRIILSEETTNLILMSFRDSALAASIVGSRFVSLDTIVCTWAPGPFFGNIHEAYISDRLVEATGNRSLNVQFLY